VHDLRNLVAPAYNALHLMRRRATADGMLLSMVDVVDRQLTGMLRLLEVAIDAPHGKLTGVETHTGRRVAPAQ